MNVSAYTSSEEEEIPIDIGDLEYFPHVSSFNDNNDEHGVMRFYVKLIEKNGEKIIGSNAKVQILEYYLGEDSQAGYTDGNGYIGFSTLINETYIVLVQYNYPTYETACFIFSPSVEDQTFTIFLAERAGRESVSVNKVETTNENPTYTGERGDNTFYVWKMKYLGKQKGQYPVVDKPVIMTEQDTESDTVQGKPSEDGFVILHPYIGKSYEIKIEYTSRYEMVKMIVDPTVEDQNFNFYLIQRQIEKTHSKIKTPLIISLLEKLKVFPFFENLFSAILKNS